VSENPDDTAGEVSVAAEGDRAVISIRDRAAALPPLPGSKSRVYFARDCDGQVFYLGYGESWWPLPSTAERMLSATEWLRPALAVPLACSHRWRLVECGTEFDELRCERCGVVCRCAREVHRGRVAAIPTIAPAPRLDDALREVSRLREALLDISAKAKAGAQALCVRHPKIADGFRLIQAFADQAAEDRRAG
jgi:hypothetical protein